MQDVQRALWRNFYLGMRKFKFDGRKATTFLFVLLALFGVLLIQYLHNRSLWVDEARLALNIINRNPAGLLRTLDDEQVAPVLFLLVEKFFVAAFGTSEYALRLFPLLCASLSLPLFYVLCRYLTNSRNFSLCAMILLGLGPVFVYYSSEVKQYMVDLSVLLMLYSVAFLPLPFLKRSRGLMLTLAGAIAIFLSNVSVIPLTVIGMAYLYDMWKARCISAARCLPLIGWAAFFGINFFLFIYQHPYTAYMKHYWRRSFLPLNPFSEAFQKLVDKMVPQLFRDLLPSLPWGYLFFTSLIIYISGLVLMVLKKDRRLLYLCLAPLILHLGMSAMKLYPFELRMLLYQAPLLIVVMMYAIWHLVRHFARQVQTRRIVLTASMVLLTFKIFLNFPIDHDEIRPAIAYLNRMARSGESLYVFWGSTPATRYYMHNGLAKFDSLCVVWGSARSDSSDCYLMDLQPIKGPTWLLISHLYSYYGDRVAIEEVIQNLMKRGRLLQYQNFQGSTVYQFDLH
jgi:uncharacterized membrane protein